MENENLITTAATEIAEQNASVKKKRVRHPCQEIIGKEFTWLTVLEFGGIRKAKTYKMAQYLVRCRCGKTYMVLYPSLANGDTTSCGCRKQQLCGPRFLKHGHAAGYENTKTYNCWKAMISRCRNEKDSGYENYGKRGIKACSGMEHFDGFLKIMGVKPSKLTIDRINVNGNYSCGICVQCQQEKWTRNVRWATNDQQANNKRSSIFIECFGERMTIMQWCNRTGLAWNTLWHRIFKKKWSPEKSLTTPPKGTGKRPRPKTQFVGALALPVAVAVLPSLEDQDS